MTDPVQSIAPLLRTPTHHDTQPGHAGPGGSGGHGTGTPHPSPDAQPGHAPRRQGPSGPDAEQTPALPGTGQGWWARARRGGVALSLLLGACGGGGGGGSDTSVQSASSASSGTPFPFGVGWAAATNLTASGNVLGGTTGVEPLDLGTTSAPAQAMLSAQVDAVANGRVGLAASGWLQPSALFATTVDGDASCWSPAVAYVAHDDAPSDTASPLPAGEVSLWRAETDSTSHRACAEAQVGSRLTTLNAQAHQALLLMAALRWRVYSDSAIGEPAAGARIDLTTQATSLLQGLLDDASVSAASIAMNSDGSELSYRLRLTRGSGASAQSLELTLLHTPADADTRYAGGLNI